MVKNIKICFVGNLAATFIRRDYEILNKHFDVDVIEPPKKKKEWTKYPSLIKNKVKCDIVFGWFAGWHTAFAVHYARRYKKKSIVVVGGYDAAYVPEISYGAFTNVKEKLPAKYVLENADTVLPFSNFSKTEVLRRAKPKNIQVVYIGIDTNEFKPAGNKENIVVTVGAINKSNLKRKGIETFVKAAEYLPDAHFAVIGKPRDKSIDYLKSIATTNVEFTGFVSDEELLKWYQRAKVYVQPSAHEGFGCSVAEAMLCGCIPIVTNIGSLPEVVEYTGFYVPYGDEKAITDGIRKALDSPDELGKKARERIREMFPMERREKELVKIIEKI